MEETLSAMSEIKEPKIPKVSRKSNGFSRADVVSAFQSAFEIIGGVDRLSLWANANPEDRKSTRLNSSHLRLSRMPSSA